MQNLDTITLGRTGIQTTRAGLGGGGFSKLGKTSGGENAQDIVRLAYEEGIRCFDTAEVYGTEQYFGEALNSYPRNSFTLCSKLTYERKDPNGEIVGIKSSQEIRKSCEQSLKTLKTDYLDIYYLHACHAKDYDIAREQVLPELMKLKDEGKIRSIGITEGFSTDPYHETLSRAVLDAEWEVLMVGYNILNQNAAKTIFPEAQSKDTVIMNMFATRKALVSMEYLSTYLKEHNQELQESSTSAEEIITIIGGLLAKYPNLKFPDLAYQFCRDQEAVHVVLFGTGNPHHVSSNINALNAPKIPESVIKTITKLFDFDSSLTGQ